MYAFPIFKTAQRQCSTLPAQSLRILYRQSLQLWINLELNQNRPVNLSSLLERFIQIRRSIRAKSQTTVRFRNGHSVEPRKIQSSYTTSQYLHFTTSPISYSVNSRQFGVSSKIANSFRIAYSSFLGTKMIILTFCWTAV
jgi:hypothetical protein